MFHRKLPFVSLIRLAFAGILFLSFGVLASMPVVPAAAQGSGTAVPPITISEPTLSPPMGAGQFPDGWLKIVGKSPEIIYLTANRPAADGVSGGWQPPLAQTGVYRVEVYIGVNEFREFARLFPEKLAGVDRLTGSAQYRIAHDGGETAVTIDQDLRESGWVPLGDYQFSAGGNNSITLGSATDETAGTTVLALSAVQFTWVGEALPPTPTATDVPAQPTPTDTPIPPTAVPTPLPESMNILGFGDLEFTSGESGEYQQVEVPLFVAGQPAGQMKISYPPELASVESDNIEANILVNDDFADVLRLALEDVTNNEELGDLIVTGQFFLTLDAAALEFDDTLKTQKLTIFQGLPAGAAWNVRAKAGISGQQNFNIKVILQFTDGIPEVSGPPPTFTMNILPPPPPSPTPTLVPTPTPSTGGRVVDNLIDNTAVLIGACLSFIVGILGVLFAYLNYRRKNAPGEAPAALDTEHKVRLHRWLDEFFNEQELRTLAMEMGVDYDDLQFSGQTNKARELVGWCARKGRLDELTAVIQQHRPHLSDQSSPGG